jgi:hypothetical protein
MAEDYESLLLGGLMTNIVKIFVVLVLVAPSLASAADSQTKWYLTVLSGEHMGGEKKLLPNDKAHSFKVKDWSCLISEEHEPYEDGGQSDPETRRVLCFNKKTAVHHVAGCTGRVSFCLGSPTTDMPKEEFEFSADTCVSLVCLR